MAEIERLTPAAMRTVTPELWQKYVDHVKEVEDKYWVQDGLIDVVEDCLSQFGEENSEDSDSEIDIDGDDAQ